MESCAIAGLFLLSVLLQTRACVVAPRKPCINFTPEELGSKIKENYDYVLSPSPLLLTGHPESVSALQGSNVSFTCSIGNVPIVSNGSLHTFPISWRFNGSSHTVGGRYPQHWSVEGVQANTSTLTVHNISYSDDGYYECMVRDGLNSTGQWASVTVSKRAWLNKRVGTSEVPVLGLEHKDLHKLGGFETQFIGECRVTGPNQTLYWYKDGRDVTQYYDDNTGQLNYNIAIDGEVHGVYQCFVENDAGSDYVNFRALPKFFADPPSNFSCVAVDREGNQPSLLVSWGAPPLISSGLSDKHKYIIKVNNNCYDAGSSTCAEVQLMTDNAVRCSVYLDLDVSASRMTGGVAAVENFNTATQRRYSTPRQLSVNCSSSNVTVHLPSPEIFSNAVCLESITLLGVCLHHGSVYRTSLEPDPYDDLNCEFPFSLDLEVVPQPPGSVCLFGGHYQYITAEPEPQLIVAPVSCALPGSLGDDVELSLSCIENNISVTWNGSHPVNVTGICYTPQLDLVILEPITLSPGGQEVNSSHHIPYDSVCMYATPTNLSAQCIIGRSEEDIEPSTNTTSTNTTTSTNITTTSPAPAGDRSSPQH